MRQHSLIVGLRDRLGDRMESTDSENETPQDGRFKAVFTPTGFSLRVRRRDDENGPVALLSVRDGEFLIFPSRIKLNRCLPGHKTEVEAYMSLVVRFGCDVDVEGHNAKPWIRLSDDLNYGARISGRDCPLPAGPRRPAGISVETERAASVPGRLRRRRATIS